MDMDSKQHRHKCGRNIRCCLRIDHTIPPNIRQNQNDRHNQVRFSPAFSAPSRHLFLVSVFPEIYCYLLLLITTTTKIKNGQTPLK